MRKAMKKTFYAVEIWKGKELHKNIYGTECYFASTYGNMEQEFVFENEEKAREKFEDINLENEVIRGVKPSEKTVGKYGRYEPFLMAELNKYEDDPKYDEPILIDTLAVKIRHWNDEIDHF